MKKQIQIQSPAKGKKVKPAANKSFGGRCGGSESMKQITKPAHIPLYERAQQQLTRKKLHCQIITEEKQKVELSNCTFSPKIGRPPKTRESFEVRNKKWVNKVNNKIKEE